MEKVCILCKETKPIDAFAWSDKKRGIRRSWCLPCKRAYRRRYDAERYYKQKQELIELLGGCCVQCGDINDLQFDHVDRDTKHFSIGRQWSRKREVLLEEINKCQLLCRGCHNKKTVVEIGKNIIKGSDIHGTLSSYRYCKCDICRKAKNDHYREWKKKRKLGE